MDDIIPLLTAIALEGGTARTPFAIILAALLTDFGSAAGWSPAPH
jgi:hypothetical protein